MKIKDSQLHVTCLLKEKKQKIHSPYEIKFKENVLAFA